jgi:hypothetical protein
MPNNNKLAPDTFIFPRLAALDTPDAGYVGIAVKDGDGLPYAIDENGVETALGGGGGGDLPEPITATFTIASGFSRTESNVQIASGGELIINGSLYIV